MTIDFEKINKDLVIAFLLVAISGMIFFMTYFYPSTFDFSETSKCHKWLDIVTWGGVLLITGYAITLRRNRGKSIEHTDE